MKKYTLTNYAGSGSTTSSDLLAFSGIVDSGVVISGMVESGIVNPDDDGTWDYGTYTEEEMEEMMKNGTWNGGYVNGAYVMPELGVIGNGGSSTGGPGAGHVLRRQHRPERLHRRKLRQRRRRPDGGPRPG